MSEEKRSHSVIEIDKKRRAAEKETNLMRAQAARNAANEKKRNGKYILPELNSQSRMGSCILCYNLEMKLKLGKMEMIQNHWTLLLKWIQKRTGWKPPFYVLSDDILWIFMPFLVRPFTVVKKHDS